jgi:HD-GYP domain-containing protein (c-di-GMP phosphodiesterase class II)
MGQKLLGSSRQELMQLGLGGLMHDVGKTMVSQEILTKTGPLTRDEMEEMRRHPRFSYELIAEHKLPEPVLEAGLHHHERADGSGYPDGLLLAETDTHARIVAVADVYDAITSDRVYRKGKPHVLALEEMAGDSKIFDSEAFQALLQVVLQNQKLVDEFTRRSISAIRLPPGRGPIAPIQD